MRLVESVHDAWELNDDLVNYEDMIIQMDNIERRLFQIFEIARSQGVKINIDVNIRSGTTVCPHYRWLPPHCYRLKDYHAGDLGVVGFKMDRRLAPWTSGKLCNTIAKDTAKKNLNALRLRMSDNVEAKDLYNTVTGAQTVQNLAQVWRYTTFQTRFFNRAAAARDLSIPPLFRVCNYSSCTIDVLVMDPKLYSILLGTANGNTRFDVYFVEDPQDWKGCPDTIQQDSENPELIDFFYLEDEVKAMGLGSKENTGTYRNQEPGPEFATPATGR